MGFSRQLRKILFAIFAWIIAIATFVLFRYSQAIELPRWADDVSDLIFLVICLGLILGLFHWLSDIICEFFNINRLPYFFSVMFKGLFLFLGATSVLYISQLANLWALEYHIGVKTFITASSIYSPSFQALVVYLVVVRIALAFIERMILLVGPRVLFNIGFGLYHSPRYEQRIFLYIDMIGSTEHTEFMGDYLFSTLIQDTFGFLADPVANNNAEIYRYVGDAAIIHWTLNEGVSEDRCFNLYFQFIAELEKNREYFLNKYKMFPEFKAAAHCGRVVAAVVGVNKQEISYFSDVLNTLARILDLCTSMNQQFLISGELKEKMLTKNYLAKEEGCILLKGKKKSNEIFSVLKR